LFYFFYFHFSCPFGELRIAPLNQEGGAIGKSFTGRTSFSSEAETDGDHLATAGYCGEAVR
jgi:hypothetical protein